MGAVDVGVGHHDHLFVAQILIPIVRAGPAAERLQQISELLVLRQLILAGGRDVENLAAQRQYRLRSAIARLLRGTAGRIPLDDEDLGALRGGIGAVGELARETQLAHRALARALLLLPAPDALLRAVNYEVEKFVGLSGIAGQPVVEWIADRVLDDARGLGGREPIFCLALEFRLANDHRDHTCGPLHYVVDCDHWPSLALADALGMVFDSLQQRATQARLVSAAVRRRNRIAIRRQESVAICGPRDRPLRRSVHADFAGAAGENVVNQGPP